MSVRLVRTTSEMEGRVTEVWALVDDEDGLDLWTANDQLGVVGRPATREDGLQRAAGGVTYTVDVRLPGLLHAAVLRSPVAHGRVVRLELEAARALDGVRRVLGPASKLSFSPSVPLLVEEPVYAGQPIALVAADTPAQARAALDAMSLMVEQLPHLIDAEEAVREMRFTTEPSEEARGDAESALASAEVLIEVELETPDQLQTPLEPHAAVGRWDGGDLTVWLSTQGMFDACRELSQTFGLEPDRVRVISEYIGGGFGGKQGAGFEAIAAAELARLTSRPVRLVNDRHSEQLDGGRRSATKQTIRLGAGRDGRLTAVATDAVIDEGQRG